MLHSKENTANHNTPEIVSGTKIPITELILTVTQDGGDITISRILNGHNLPSSRIDEVRKSMRQSASIILKERTCQTDRLTNTVTLPDQNTKMLKLLLE